MVDLADVKIAHGTFGDMVRCEPRHADLVPWGHESVSKVLEGWGTSRDGVDVEILIYEHSYRRKGRTRRRRTAVAIVRHPRLKGGATVSPDLARWGPGWAALMVFSILVLTVLLLPIYVLAAPFWLGHAIYLLATGRRPSLPFPFNGAREVEVGDPEFDHLYLVHATSAATAADAVVPALREYLVANRFHGKLTFHDGAIVIGGATDAELRQRAEAIAEIVARQTGGHPMR